MFTTPQYLNESFNKEKSIIIEVSSPDDMRQLVTDLKSWGYHYDEEHTPEDELYNEYYYPYVISFSAPKLTSEFFIYTPDAYDEVEEEDFDAYNIYSYVSDFYEHEEALNYIKYGLPPKTPSYRPRKIDRTLEKSNFYPFRFKTENEFEEEFGGEWRSVVHHSWESPGMDELFGVDYPFYVNKETNDSLPDMSTECEYVDDYGDGEDYGGYFDDWSISWDMLTPNKPRIPSYRPRKTERTLESYPTRYYNPITKKLTSWPYRFKIEEEFNETCALDGHRRWNCGGIRFTPPMHHLFGQTFEYDFPEMTEKMTIPREHDDDVWYITKPMLVKNEIGKPDYNPRKTERTLESLMMPKYPDRFLTDAPWDVIIFRYNTKEGLERTKNYIQRFENFIYFVAISNVFPADIYMVLKSTAGLRKNNLYEVTHRYFDSGDFQRSFPDTIICPILLNMDNDTEEADNLFNTHIFKAFPNYKPRHVDKSLDVNEAINSNTKYNFVIFKFENQDDFENGQHKLRERGFTWYDSDTRIVTNEKDFPCYIFVQGKKGNDWDNHIYYDSENGLENRSPFQTIRYRGTGARLDEICPKIFTLEQVPLVNKLFDYGLVPNYEPKKTERTLESFGYNKFEGVVFEVDNPKENEQCQNELFRFGFKWPGEHTPRITDFEVDIYPVYIFTDTRDQSVSYMSKDGADDYGSIENYIQDCINNGEKICPKVFRFNDSKHVEAILKHGNIAPNYQPRKFDRTFESFGKKVLWAFDMDDTLVYSKRFEEHIKPLILKEEFLTPEIILNNKVDDIGIKIKDLKYEHGRVYFDDPKQIVNISNNPSWVRKGDRVYITQPDAYFLTEESMPVGTYQRIVDLYNDADNKAIITARRERLRKQTESALNNLGVEPPNCGLFMYPSDSLVFQAKWKALKLEELYNQGFTEIHYFDDNIKILKRIKSYLGKDNINITLYKVNENNYRKI